MNIPAISIVIWFGLVAAAAAQGAPSSKAASSGEGSKAQLSEVRSLVHELQAQTEKLRDLMTQYRSLVEQRPQGQGEQIEKWNSALERLLRRLDTAHAAVADATQRLDQSAKGQLPTGLAKEVASAHNDAEAERTAAEQVLAKNKPAQGRTKEAKQKPAEKPAPPIPDDL
jgi:hypothetical protein